MQSVRIDGGRITVRLLDRHVRESFAVEPGVAVIRRFALRGGALAKVASP